MNYVQLERKVTQLEQKVQEQDREIQQLKRQLIGPGVIQNSGNRLNIDISANLSEFAKKTDLS